MLNDAELHNIIAAVKIARSCAPTHWGEIPLIFHLATWIAELQQPESTDFQDEDNRVNLCALIELMTDNQPVYRALMPVLDYCLTSVGSDPDDDDGVELGEAIVTLRDFLDSRDTTVRETY